MIGLIISKILIFTYVFLVPPYLINMLMRKNSLIDYLYTFSYTFMIYPFIIFYILFFSKQFIQIDRVLITNTLFIFILCSILLFKRSKIKPSKRKENKKGYILLIILIIFFTFNFVTFNIIAKEIFDCTDTWTNKNLNLPYTIDYYNIAPETKFLKIPINESFNGLNLTEFGLDHLDFEYLDYFLIQKNRGSIFNNYFNAKGLTDEPYSSSIHFSIFLELFNYLGVRLFYSITLALLSFFVYLISISITQNKLVSYLSIILINLTALNLKADVYNPNYIAMLFLFGMLSFIVPFIIDSGKKVKKSNFILGGIFYALLVSIRPISLVFLPSLIFAIYKKSNLKPMLIFLVVTLIAAVPNMTVNYIIYKNPLQFPAFDLPSPRFEHSFFGLKFYSSQLFNFPFYKEVIRSPHFPYPNFIDIPLILINSLGIFLTSALYFGFRKIKNGRLKIFLVTFLFSFLLILAISEKWTATNNALLQLIFPILAIISFFGLFTLFKNLNGKKILIYFVIMAIVITTLLTLRLFNFERDPRINTIYTMAELPDEIQLKKQQMTEMNMLPNILVPEVTSRELYKEIGNKMYFLPPFTAFYGECLKRDILLSKNNILWTEKGTYLIVSYEHGKNISGFKEIKEINVTNKTILFTNIMLPSGCSAIDLEVSIQGDLASFNFLPSNSTSLPEYMFAKVVKVNNLDNSIIRRCIFNNYEKESCIDRLFFI